MAKGRGCVLTTHGTLNYPSTLRLRGGGLIIQDEPRKRVEWALSSPLKARVGVGMARRRDEEVDARRAESLPSKSSSCGERQIKEPDSALGGNNGRETIC